MKKQAATPVEVKLDKNPPITGPNKMEINIKDDKGGNVTDATGSCGICYARLPGMPAMNYKAKTELSGRPIIWQMSISMQAPGHVISKFTRCRSIRFLPCNSWPAFRA